MEEISRRLFQQLDNTGYNYNMIQSRSEHFRSLGKLMSARYDMKVIIGGSKGEGMTKPLEGDHDTLFFLDNIVCVDDPTSIHLFPAHFKVFSIVNTQPGYCVLELNVREGMRVGARIAECLVSVNGKFMLSSNLIGAELCTSNDDNIRTGPAVTFSFSVTLMADFVLTIPCHCLSILKDFVNRPRSQEWPSSSLLQTILQMTGNLVATGSDDSETEHLEWRYCFNEIEMLIMATLNDTQMKLYKLLKITNNDIFKQRGLSLTSFMMKNIIFWLAETHAQSLFLPETLYHWLCEALLLLRQYVVDNKLPYYMIPDRNLLKEKVKESDRPKLIQVITDVIESDPAMLFECETIVRYASLIPQELSMLKHKLEVLELCYEKYHRTYSVLSNQRIDPRTDPLFQVLDSILRQILRCGWPSMVQQRIAGCENDTTALKMLLG